MHELPPIFQGDAKAEAREAGLAEALFTPCENDPELRCYLLLDAAASSDIPVCLAGFDAPARCLFDGQTRDELEDVAPWLVQISRHQAVTSWYAEEGHGRDWGIVIHSRLELARLKTRLKRFLRVQDESGQELFFKFYRPRNLNAILPEFEPDQRASFFSGIEAILAEDRGNPDLLHRHLPDGSRAPEAVDLVRLGQRLAKRPGDAASETDLLLQRMRSRS